MECKVCGRHVDNEDANFCENCGNSFRENYQNNDNNAYKQQNNNYNQENTTYNQRNTNSQYSYGQESNTNNQYNTSDQYEKPISFGQWMLILGLPYLLMLIPVPFAGTIIYFVILLVWAFSNNTQPSKKNYAKANLLITVIVTVLAIILVAGLLVAISNGTFPIEGLEGLEGFEGFNGGGNFY